MMKINLKVDSSLEKQNCNFYQRKSFTYMYTSSIQQNNQTVKVKKKEHTVVPAF